MAATLTGTTKQVELARNARRIWVELISNEETGFLPKAKRVAERRAVDGCPLGGTTTDWLALYAELRTYSREALAETDARFWLDGFQRADGIDVIQTIAARHGLTLEFANVSEIYNAMAAR